MDDVVEGGDEAAPADADDVEAQAGDGAMVAYGACAPACVWMNAGMAWQ